MRTYKVYTFWHPDLRDRPSCWCVLAYLRDANSDQPGCIVYDIEARSGVVAKKLARQLRYEHEMGTTIEPPKSDHARTGDERLLIVVANTLDAVVTAVVLSDSTLATRRVRALQRLITERFGRLPSANHPMFEQLLDRYEDLLSTVTAEPKLRPTEYLPTEGPTDVLRNSILSGYCDMCRRRNPPYRICVGREECCVYMCRSCNNAAEDRDVRCPSCKLLPDE